MPSEWLYTIHCRRGIKIPLLGFVYLIRIINEPDNLILHNHIPVSNSTAPHLSVLQDKQKLYRNKLETKSMFCWG